MSMVNSFDAGRLSEIDDGDRELLERRMGVLGSAYRLFYEVPVHLVSSDGVWLYGNDGRRYLDAYNNVACVGHCHPRVVEAIRTQLGVLNTHTRYLQEKIVDYAERLTATFPAGLDKVMFTCTGSEANDLAVRIARHVTGGTGIIVTRLAYHGLTAAVAEFSPSLGEHVDLGPHVRTVAAPDTYRNAEGDVGARFGRDVELAIADLRRHGIKPAMLIVDTIFSSDGVFADPAGFLKPAVTAIKAAGGLFVADEVQPGFGRTGEAMWGFQRHGVDPDMVSIGKPMGNGYPVAGLICKPQVIDEFGKKARYFNTFGGNGVAASAGLAVLDVIRDEGLLDNARETGAYLLAGFRALAATYPTIGDVRGVGLFIGVEMVSDRKEKTPSAQYASQLVNALRVRGILISASGPNANVLKIRPPLVFSRSNAEFLLSEIADILKSF